MKSNKALAQRLKTLERRIAMIEALADFLKRHPDLAARCKIKNLWYGPGLQFEEKAFIKAVAPKSSEVEVRLRLEKFLENGSDLSTDEGIICDDISQLGENELASVLLQARIDLSKPPDYDGDDEVEDDA
jgi:hypothetical protein